MPACSSSVRKGQVAPARTPQNLSLKLELQGQGLAAAGRRCRPGAEGSPTNSARRRGQGVHIERASALIQSQAHRQRAGKIARAMFHEAEDEPQSVLQSLSVALHIPCAALWHRASGQL